MKKFLLIIKGCGAGVLLGSIAVATIVAYIFFNMSFMYDTVTITALGEAGYDSSTGYQEVTLISADSKGKDVKIIPVSGKWFYNPNLMWRPEYDNRQPDGTTRAISFHIPVGTERQITFLSDIWQGKALLSINRGADSIDMTIDNYSEAGYHRVIELDDSAWDLQKRNLILRAGAAFIGWIAVFIIATALLSTILRNKEKLFSLLKQRWNVVSIIALSAFMLAVMHISLVNGNASLWGDEYGFPLGLAMSFEQGDWGSFSSLWVYDGGGLVIYNLLFCLWYQIIPFGDAYLFLFPQIFIVGSVLLIGLLSTRMFGKAGGVVTTIIASTFITLGQMGNFLRGYAGNELFIAIFLMAYYMRMRNAGKESVKNLVAYGVSLVCLVASYYYYVIFCAAIFIIDIVLIALRKIRFRCVFSYALGGALFLPYGLWLLSKWVHGSSISFFADPSLYELISALNNILLDNWLLLFAYFLTLSLAVGSVFIWRDDKNKAAHTLVFINIAVIVTMLTMYIHSIVDQNGSVWQVDHLRTMLLMIFILTIGYSLSKLTDALMKAATKEIQIITIACIVSLFAFRGFDFLSDMYLKPKWISSSRDDATVEHLLLQPDIFSPDTVVWNSHPMNWNDAYWEDWYVSQKGTRDMFLVENSIKGGVYNPSRLLRYKRVYTFNPYGYYAGNDIDDILSAHYVLDYENYDLALRAYNRKE